MYTFKITSIFFPGQCSYQEMDYPCLYMHCNTLVVLFCMIWIILQQLWAMHNFRLILLRDASLNGGHVSLELAANLGASKWQQGMVCTFLCIGKWDCTGGKYFCIRSLLEEKYNKIIQFCCPLGHKEKVSRGLSSALPRALLGSYSMETSGSSSGGNDLDHHWFK